jgi:acetylglutamate kinase
MKNSRIVVKIGGSLLNDETRQEALVKQIADLVTESSKVLVVHGGGKALTSLLDRLDVPSQFHDGLRITDAATMDAALMTLAGVVNKKLVAAFAAVGCRAIGLCGGDGGAILAEKLEHKSVDYGFVGKVSMINTELIDLLLCNDYLPVIACIAMGADHHYYNINADQMAAACAVALQADQLVFLTDVDGVLSKQRRVIPKINPKKVKSLVADKVVTGGMLPKLNACLAALDGGVGGINILNGSVEDCLKRLIAGGESLGTSIRAGAAR